MVQGDAAGEVIVAQNEAQRRDIWETRRYLSVNLKALHPRKLSEDIAVPRSRIPEMVARAKAIGARRGLRRRDLRPRRRRQPPLQRPVRPARTSARRWTWPWRRSCGPRSTWAGTITGEHGVGLAKRDFLEYEQGREVVALERRLKAVFDPLGILNPGKIFRD